jgi:S-adenosylmethionine:tRNA ribosyltransferase-isomerase
MHPKDLSIYDFTYDLPDDKIAPFPLPERDGSKLLIYKEGKITSAIYRNIDDHLPPGSLLVFNNSRVIEARLLFQKPTGGVVEIFCLEPDKRYNDVSSAMQQQGSVVWKCLIGGASKWKHGQLLEKKIANGNEQLLFSARYIDKTADAFLVELSWQPASLSFAEVLHLAGAIPLPPYIKRKPDSNDVERYQTIYAMEDGSVAAPTAGLHFSPLVFEKLKARNITTTYLTLHVGAGTFKPVKSETMAGHEMHAEFIDVSRTTLQQLLDQPDQIIAVGTTSLRTLESLYWLGVKAKYGLNTTGGPLLITQWEPYELDGKISTEEALLALLHWMKENQVERLLAKTQIIIAPGYAPKLVKALITNFHQPQSTLLLLVAALIGDGWREVYDYALRNDFRFLSYGDGCLLWISP